MTNETENRIPLDDLLVFHQLARSLTSSFDLDTILRTILEHMERIIEAELWTLLMLDESRQELYYAIAAGGEAGSLARPAREGGRGRGRLGGRARRNADRSRSRKNDPRLQQTAGRDNRRKVRSVIALPLRGRKGTQGVIEILNPRAEPADRLHHRLSAHPGRPRRHRH